MQAWGNYVRLTFDNGWSSIYMPLSAFEVADGARVQAGDVIGWSGNTGDSDGPHLHWHLEDTAGERQNPLDHVSDSSGGGLSRSSTEDDGEPGPNFYARMQNWLKKTS